MVITINATAARPIVPRVNIVAAAVARVLAHAEAARISLKTRHTLVRAWSIRITAAGGATLVSIIAVANASAAPTKAAARINTARASVITRAATATSATVALPIVPRVNIAAAAAARALAHAKAARISPHTPHILARAPST